MENNAVDIGLLLKERREALGYSLEEAARKTRIRQTHLESIEKNQFADLPGHAYIIGFIKVYARYLGIDSQPLLDRFETEPRFTGRPLESLPIIEQQTRRSLQTKSVSRWGVFISATLLVLVTASLIYILPSIFKDEPSDKAVPAPAAIDQMAVQRPVNEQVNSAGQKAVAPLADEKSMTVESAPAAPERPPLPQIPEQGGSLRMLALGKSSLIIYIDELQPHSYTLHDGLDLTWQVQNKVRVEMADEDAARFWLNGEELALKGRKEFQLHPIAGE